MGPPAAPPKLSRFGEEEPRPNTAHRDAAATVSRLQKRIATLEIEQSELRRTAARIAPLEKELQQARELANARRTTTAAPPPPPPPASTPAHPPLDATLLQAELRQAEAAATAQALALRQAEGEATQWREEAGRWRRRAERAEAAEREGRSVDADKKGDGEKAALERELKEAHECIATLRAARWRPVVENAAATAAAAKAANSEQLHSVTAECRRYQAEATVLVRELFSTEQALQGASAAAVALSGKAEALLLRLTESTAMRSSEVIQRSVRHAAAASTLPRSGHGSGPRALMPSSSENLLAARTRR